MWFVENNNPVTIIRFKSCNNQRKGNQLRMNNKVKSIVKSGQEAVKIIEFKLRKSAARHFMLFRILASIV